MIRLELTQEEATYLLSLLDEDMSDLRMEIADTDSSRFKDQLKEDKGHLQDVLTKLRAALTAGA